MASESPGEPKTAKTSPEEHSRAQRNPGDPEKPHKRPPHRQELIDGAYVRSLRIKTKMRVFALKK